MHTDTPHACGERYASHEVLGSALFSVSKHNFSKFLQNSTNDHYHLAQDKLLVFTAQLDFFLALVLCLMSCRHHLRLDSPCAYRRVADSPNSQAATHVKDTARAQQMFTHSMATLQVQQH